MIDFEVSLGVKLKEYVDTCLTFWTGFYGHRVFSEQSVLLDLLAVAFVDLDCESLLSVT